MFIRTFSALAGAAFAAATLAVSTPVFAAETDQNQTVVYIGDLNLNGETGMVRFERRVRAAARKICGEAPDHGIESLARVVSCRSQVRASAMSRAELAMNGSAPATQLALRLN